MIVLGKVKGVRSTSRLGPEFLIATKVLTSLLCRSYYLDKLAFTRCGGMLCRRKLNKGTATA